MTARILIVDDSLTIRMDLAEALEEAGFSATPCASIEAARAQLVAQSFVIAIIDATLPDGDGIDFIVELAASQSVVKPILLANAADLAPRLRRHGLDENVCIGQPYDLEQVIARVKTLVRGRTQTPNRRVLIIDDSPTYRHRITEVLTDHDFTVFEAATGEEGLARVGTLRPDVVIIDGVLPGIDGATVVRRIKSDGALRTIPCLLLTAAEGALDELKSLEAGADAHVRKSEDIEVILARLTALLRNAPPSAALAVPSLLGKKRLLAVDDSLTYLAALRDELEQEGYEVVTATSGEEALMVLPVERVDCILLDLTMPGISGQETCRRIKSTQQWRDLPLVILTARDDRDAMIEGINSGADDYIAKSADFEVLKARLRAQLRRKHFEDENRGIREKLVRREAEERYLRLIHSNIFGVIFGGLDGRITDANDAFLAMLGYTRDELEAGLLANITLTPDEWRERDAEAIEELLRRGSVPPFEKELFKSDGTRLPITMGMVLLTTSDTSVAFVIDRTEQKLAEARISSYTAALETANRELAIAKDQAERNNRAKSSFLANMSHELRTPLNAIIGFAELLHDGQVSPDMPEHREFLGDILTSGRHLLALINDILDLSKVEAGKLEFTPVPASLHALIYEVMGVLRATAAERVLELTARLSPSIDAATIDPGRFKQVLYNLVSNALKFTPAGGKVVVHCAPDGNDFFRIAVEDTGIGISESDLDRLFVEFQQLDGGASKKHGGTGLGLALTKRLVEAQGGYVGVTSKHGQGSTFHAILPIRPLGRKPRPSDDQDGPRARVRGTTKAQRPQIEPRGGGGK